MTKLFGMVCVTLAAIGCGAEAVDESVEVQEALTLTTDPCTTVAADATYSYGPGNIPAVYFDSPNATYDHPGCAHRYVVEINNIFGNVRPLWLGANWAPPGLPQDEQQCHFKALSAKWFAKSGGSWYLAADRSIPATWNGSNCLWPNDASGIPLNILRFNQGFFPYSKFRVAVNAVQLSFYERAEVFMSP